jgi:hypothetical protein
VEKAATVRRRSSFPPHMKPAYADAKRAFLLPARFTHVRSVQHDDERLTVSAGLDNVATRDDTWKMELEPTWTTP